MNNTNPLINSVLTDCITALVCPAGEFYPNKNYGSQIKRNSGRLDEEKLLCYARQALSNMDGVYVKSASIDNSNAVFKIAVNNEERQVSISI